MQSGAGAAVHHAEVDAALRAARARRRRVRAQIHQALVRGRLRQGHAVDFFAIYCNRSVF